MPAALSLPTELAEPILALCVRLVAASSLWCREAIAHPLTALSRSDAPLVTKAALMQMPRFDLNWATYNRDVAMLNFMVQWSKQPNGRPLNYDPGLVVSLALQGNFPDVLDWWLDKSGLIVDWDWSDNESVFCGQDGIKWLEWWKSRGFPYLEDRATFRYVIVAISRAGRVDILDWLLEHVGADSMVPGAEHGNAIQAAANGGHVEVLDWWVTKAQAGVIANLPELSQVFNGAVRNNHGAVLTWCKDHPQVLETLRQARKANAHRPQPFWEAVYADAVRNGLMDWFDTLDLMLYDQEKIEATVTACKTGDLMALENMFAKGYLIGSRVQLIQVAVASGNLEVLDWIHANIDGAAPSHFKGALSSYRAEPFVAMCQVSDVSVLDWLVEKGYKHLVDDGPQATHAKLVCSAVSHANILVLDWLLKCGYVTAMVKEDLSQCFISASSNGFLAVMEWLADNAMSSNSIAQLDTVTITNALEQATKGYHVGVLDWWLRQLTTEEWSQDQKVQPTNSDMLDTVFLDGRIDVLDWWLHKSGPLQDLFDWQNMGHPYLYACNCNYDVVESEADILQVARKNADHLSALQVWYRAGRPMDCVRTIHRASIKGRIDVLHWMLNDADVTEQDFAQAWTSPAFQRDERNHGWSLLWWQAYLPQVYSMPVTCAVYENPIHAHIHDCMLKNVPLGSLGSPIRPYEAEYWNVAMLAYLARRGVDLLQENCSHSLVMASKWGLRHVLEWWKSESGVTIDIPNEILLPFRIHRRAMQWWVLSGLMSENQVATTILQD